MCVNNGDASGLEFFRHKTCARALPMSWGTPRARAATVNLSEKFSERGWQVGWKQSGWQLFAHLIRFVAVAAKGFWHNCDSSHTHSRRGYTCVLRGISARTR